MNIHSIAVTNMHYDRAIQPELLKKSQEYRTLATLRHLLPFKYDGMVVCDAPDLQDIANGVGIEVTTAVRATEMQSKREFARYCESSSDSMKDRSKKKLESLGYVIKDLDFANIITSPIGTSYEEEREFKNAIEKKARKVCDYRRAFSTLGLAVLLPEIPTTDAENNIIAWIHQVIIGRDIAFDFYYVISERFCLYYDVATEMSCKWTISSEDNKLLCTVGRMTAEGNLTMSSSEWIDQDNKKIETR